MTHLLAGRFEGSDTSAAILEQFSDVQIEGVSWSLDAFGLDRIELTVPARSRVGAYQRYDEHLGQRLAVYGSDLARPISGWITEARLVPGNRIRYVALGPGFKMKKRRIYRTYAATDDIATVITSIVSEFMPYCTSDTSHIAANTVAIGGWGVRRPTGSTPAEAIRELCNFSDASYLIRDFWLVDEPFNGTSLGGFIPYYQARTATVDAAWIVNTNELQEPQAARSLENMVTSVRVFYGLISGTITGLSGNTLTDSSATFITDNVKSGDVVENKTVGGDATIVSVDSETQLTLGGWRAKHIGRTTNDAGGGTSLIDQNTDFVAVGAQSGDIIKNDTDRSQGTVTGITTTYQANDTLQIAGGMTGSGGTNNGADERYSVYGSPTVGDDYAIRTSAANVVEANVTTVGYWEAEYATEETGMDPDQALQYANALLIDEPQQVEPFTIGSAMVRDANGAKWPNWELIAQAARSIKIADLYPSVTTLAGTADRRTVFYVTSLEWVGDDLSLRVTIDAADRRLDARLRRERIIGSAGLF